MDVDSDSDGDNWSEDEDNSEPVKCLFCDSIFNSVEQAIKHLTAHNIYLNELKAKFGMDCYSYIKMINYIRTHKLDANDLQKIDAPLWDDEKYLKPVEFEPWLTYGGFDRRGVTNSVEIISQYMPLDFESLEVDSTNSHVDIPLADITKLRSLVTQLEKEVSDKNAMLQQAAEDISKMRQSFMNLIEKESNSDSVKSPNDKITKSVASISLERDDNYFSSYSHYGIHHDMLADEVRTATYRNALLKNKELLKGKSVLDLGCGTSILSMFAAQAGAETVVAIDNSEIIYQAMEIAKTNKFDSIKFVKGRLEDTELPVDRFDFIVSEWMGYFLVFEGMLDSVIYARDRHLKLGGALIPNRCNLSIVGHGDENRHRHYVAFWKDVYGFDMSCMQKEVLREAVVEVVKPEHVLTDSNVIADYDLMRVDVNYSNFSYDFNLMVLKNGRLTSFVGYFDTFFDLPNKFSFSTSPTAQSTHWKQVTFFLKDPVDVKEGETITGTITCRRSARDMRSISIRIQVFGNEYGYVLD